MEESKRGRRRSRILVQMTLIIVAVLIAAGFTIFAITSNSQNRLINESIEKLVQTEAESALSSFKYSAELQVPIYIELFANIDVQEALADISNRRISDLQRRVNEDIKMAISLGFLNLEYELIILLPSQFMPEAFVFASNDESMIYNWEVPGFIIDAIEESPSYLLMEEGIPELGLEGEHLIIATTVDNPIMPGLVTGYVGVIPMQEKIASINDFYSSERRSMTLSLLLVVAATIAVVILISFFFFSFLIRRRITAPIDKLAAAAEEVMQGNLDVEITVHEGADFEGLERAFRDLVEAFRKYIAKSVGEE